MVQRIQRAEGRAPHSLTQTSSCQTVQRKFHGKRRALKSRARTGSCQTGSWNQPGKGAPVESQTRTSSVQAPEQEARWGEWKLTDEPNPEGTPITADEISGRPSLQPDETDTCTTADGLTMKIAVCITKNGFKKKWQPSIASRKTCATIIVLFAKKHGRCLLPERRYILARDARETRSRVDYILLRTTWILEASLQNCKASVKSRNC